jgi:DNA binding domain, excisionase family
MTGTAAFITYWRAVPGPDNPDGLLTVTEACAELRVSRWTLYQLIRSGQLPSIKLRSRRVIPRQAIRELIQRLTAEEAS